MSKQLIPGDFEFVECKISPFNQPENSLDIKFIIYSMMIEESLSNGCLLGHIDVLDLENNLENFNDVGFRGEEIISLKMTDALEELYEDEYFLYSITNVEPNEQGTGVKYRMHITSKGKIYSDKKRIKRSYRGLISEVVRDIFDEYYVDSEKDIIIEPTDGQKTIVIPNMTPEEALHFLSRKAFSAVSESQTYRFFETKTSYYFCTYEFLLEQNLNDAYNYSYKPKASYDGKELADMMDTLISFKNDVRLNSVSDMRNNLYKRQVREIDIIEQRIEEVDYDYLEEYDKYFKLDRKVKPKHTDEFSEEFFEDSVTPRFVIKDYSLENRSLTGYRDNTNYAELINNKGVVFGHILNNEVIVEIYGKLKIEAGQIITLDLEEFHYDNKDARKNKFISGNYFIEKIENSFLEEEFTQKITLHKLDWNGDN